MKIRIHTRSTIFLLILLMNFYFLAGSCQSEIITYPAPPGLITSQDFTVKANDNPVWVEKIGSEVHTDKYSLYGGSFQSYCNSTRYFSMNTENTPGTQTTIQIFSLKKNNKKHGI